MYVTARLMSDLQLQPVGLQHRTTSTHLSPLLRLWRLRAPSSLRQMLPPGELRAVALHKKHYPYLSYHRCLSWPHLHILAKI